MVYLDIDDKDLQAASNLLRAVTHKLRLSIIKLLDDKGEINVNSIYTTLKLEQSITSQHLKILRDNDVVQTRRDGKMIYYTLNYDKLRSVEKIAGDIDKLIRESTKRRKHAVR
jgi:DNA-binding transcriptional ArsR family regulator